MIYFTSDLHFYHANVIQYCGRPYKTVEEMNEAIVRNWNTVVGPEDTVYALGDMSMAFRAIEVFTHRLNGKKYLIPGNHDMCHTYHKRSRTPEGHEKWLKIYTDLGWTVLPQQVTMDFEGLGTVNLCHHPYKDQEIAPGDPNIYVDKYNAFRMIDDGKILICGHVHEKWKHRNNMFNVGVDVWDMKPVSLTQLKEYIDEVTADRRSTSEDQQI